MLFFAFKFVHSFQKTRSQSFPRFVGILISCRRHKSKPAPYSENGRLAGECRPARPQQMDASPEANTFAVVKAFLPCFYQSHTQLSLHNNGNVFPPSYLTFLINKRNPFFLGDILYFHPCRFRMQLLYHDITSCDIYLKSVIYDLSITDYEVVF